MLGRVSLGEVLGRARSKVDNPAQRFKAFWGALKKALDVEGTKGFEDGGPNEGDWELSWRRTKRRGRLKLGNVREMSYDDFTPPDGAFKVLVDYPWDEPGHTVDEDRLRATNVRKNKGLLHTVCWLPRHMSPTELGVLTELAAVRYLLSDAGQEDLLETHGPQDRAKILDQGSIREKTLEGQLQDLLTEVYIRHGEFFGLMTDLDGSRPRETLAENLEHITTLLMDRHYPQHPNFLAEPKKQDLEALLEWMVQAGETNVSVAYDEAVGKVLKNLGQPLELVNLGQSKASLRLDSRYIKDVLQRVDQDTVSWIPIADHLRETYGFQPLVVDLFLCFLCQRDHRALDDLMGESIDVRIGMPPSTRVRLQRGKLVSPADWHRLRDLGSHLFNEARPPAHRSLQGQDRFAKTLRDQGQARRTVLQALHTRLVHLDVEGGDRLKEIATANARLSPLALTTTDSHKIFTDLLAAWPDDALDPIRAVVQQADVIRGHARRPQRSYEDEPQGWRQSCSLGRGCSRPFERAGDASFDGPSGEAANEGLDQRLEQEGSGSGQEADSAATTAAANYATAAANYATATTPLRAREDETKYWRRQRGINVYRSGAQGPRGARD